MITKFITTRIESIARSAARRPRYAPAHPQLFRPRLTTTRGGHIAAVCFRLRSPPDLYLFRHPQAASMKRRRRSHMQTERPTRELTPKEVLADLFEELAFDGDYMADQVIQRLIAAGF